MFSHRVDEFKQQLYFLHQNITSDSSKMQELQENSEQLEALFNRIDQMEVSDLAHWVYIGTLRVIAVLIVTVNHRTFSSQFRHLSSQCFPLSDQLILAAMYIGIASILYKS